MNLKKKFLDRKGFVRERTLHTMKSNKYLKEGDIVLVADTGFYYDVITISTEIPLQNSLFAQVRENSLVRWIKQHIAKLVTPSEDGHMRKEDKRKIDGIEDNANNYSHPTGEGYNHIPRGGSLNMALMWASPGTVKWVNLNDYYYTEAEIDEKLKTYSTTNHNHDTSYYKKLEIDNALKLKLGVNDTAKNSDKLGNASPSKSKDANTIAQRTAEGDLVARLFKSDYPDENRIEGALLFRVNTADNYLRFCSNKDVIKTWLGLGSGIQDLRYTSMVLRHQGERNDRYSVEFGSGILVTSCTYGEGPNVASQNTRQLQVLKNGTWYTVGY